VCQYPFDKRRFLEMSLTRPILHGHWIWSGRTGRVCTVNWRTFRNGTNLVWCWSIITTTQQSGEPLSDGDLGLNVLEPPTGFPKSS